MAEYLEYLPEQIVEMADQLRKEIEDSTKDIATAESINDLTDPTMAANFADRCTIILRSLAENVAELHERVDVLTEKIEHLKVEPRGVRP